jgi:hypothetical protein
MPDVDDPARFAGSVTRNVAFDGLTIDRTRAFNGSNQMPSGTIHGAVSSFERLTSKATEAVFPKPLMPGD